MITDIADYFAKGCGRCDRFATADCSARLWGEGLAALRSICLSAGLEEAVKWGHPCYRHAGRNVAIIGAFRGDFRLSLFDAGLLDDADRVLERQGPNSQHADAIRFLDLADVTRKEPAIRALLSQALRISASGQKVAKKESTLDLPEELRAALGADPALGQAFAALTPGRQRSHVIALSSAKTAQTRIARIDKLRTRILEGKGATER